MLYNDFEGKAGRSLLRSIKIKPKGLIGYDKGIGIYTVEVIIGKGNWLCRFFKDASMAISPIVRFEGEDGARRVEGLTYRVDPRVLSLKEMQSTFKIMANSKVMLALIYWKDFNLYQFEGFGSESSLNATYDATIIIRDKDFNETSEHRIKNYIRNGIVVIDKENDHEV